MSSADGDRPEIRSVADPTTVNETKTLEEQRNPGKELDQTEGPNTSEFLTSGPELEWAISQEDTADTADETTSTYTDSAPGSPSSGGEQRNVTPSLDTTRAVVKRARTDENTENPDAPPLATRETYNKRVTKKAIDKQWVPFENDSYKSFENLCGMAMNSVLERFDKSKQKAAKVEETQRLLTQHWLSAKLPKSFLARLRVTKVPPSKSLVVRMRGVTDNSFDPLSIDQVNLRKTVFETYLSAELKQLESLEAYRNSLQSTYNSDLEYLNDFKKTTSNLRGHTAQERAKHERELHLQAKKDKKETQDIKLKTKLPSLSASSRFDPDNDDDLRPLLDGINSEVSKLDANKQEILRLCDQLDIIERQLYSRKTG